MPSNIEPTPGQTSPGSDCSLLPCPFCGSSDVDVSFSVNNEETKFYAVECCACAAFGPDGGQDAAKARELWNNRANIKGSSVSGPASGTE